MVQASVRTVQGLIAPFSATTRKCASFFFLLFLLFLHKLTAMQTGQPNTLGMALNQILPTVFPSRRNPVLAAPVLHGAVVPMSAPVEDLMRAAAFTDGFLHVVVVML
jgi:autophagy-related protein 5